MDERVDPSVPRADRATILVPEPIRAVHERRYRYYRPLDARVKGPRDTRAAT